MPRVLALCTVSFLTLVSTGIVQAGDVASLDAVRRLDRTIHYLDGHGAEVATCLSSGALANAGSELEIHYHRVLCSFEDGTKIAWHRAFEIGTTGASREVLLDLGTGSWLMVSSSTDIPPRRKDEPWNDWKTRMLGADESLTSIEVETNLLRFERFSENARGESRNSTWKTLEDQQPELALLIGRLIREFGLDMQGVLAPLLVNLNDFVYAGPEVQASKFIVKSRRPELVKSDAPKSDFEGQFGRWATWPGMPRVKN